VTLCLAALFAPSVFAQMQVTSDDTTLVVRKLRFTGNRFASSTVLETIVRSRTNRELFGISGFTPWYWLWQAAPNIGEAPARLDREALFNDLQRITEYYRSVGYLEAQVRSSIVEYKPGRVEISFIIEEGQPSYIRDIYYSGVPEFDVADVVDRFYRSRTMRGTQLSDTSYAHNRRLTFENITLERERIINFLKDQGYASAQNDSVTAELRRDPINRNQIDLLFRVRPGRVYHFADAEVRVVADTETGSSGISETDTIKTSPSVIPPNTLTLVRDPASRVDFSIMKDRLVFKPGERYNQSKYLRSVSRFQELGSFSVRRFALSADGGLPNFQADSLPVLIELQALPRHRIGLDFFGMQRYGFGAGAGARYTNNNLVGGAENLEISLRGSFELYDQSLLNAFEASTRYALPRLMLPFKSLNDNPNFIDSRTSYAISYNQVRQQNFNINANIAINNRFEIRHTTKLSSTLDLFDIELIDATATQEFIDQLDERFQNNPQLVVFILEDFRPQVSSVIRYSLRRLNTDIIKRNNGSYQEYTIESAGLIPYLSDRFIVTPDTLEGDLPGLYLRSLDYTQYIKFTADYRRYKSLSPSTTLAYRGFAGAAFAYGVNDVIPITRRFFAGGSSDIRGWAPLKLGPGRAQDDRAFNGGEIKVLGQLEYRHMLVQNVLGGNLGAGYFVDAGNVWLTSRGNFSRGDLTGNTFRFDTFAKQIAVGAGSGLRMDWDYVILRLDMAFRIHDLERGWLNNKKAYLHFGVGHAF
jgi:outer membrane protein insertion porin family